MLLANCHFFLGHTVCISHVLEYDNSLIYIYWVSDSQYLFCFLQMIFLNISNVDVLNRDADDYSCNDDDDYVSIHGIGAVVCNPTGSAVFHSQGEGITLEFKTNSTLFGNGLMFTWEVLGTLTDY